jgi:predicted alpha/beta hydrolase family esterase
MGRPVLSDWLQNLNSAITAIDGKIILVTDLAVSLIAHWSTTNNNQKNSRSFYLWQQPTWIHEAIHRKRLWISLPFLYQLNYPSIVITSSNDPYISRWKERSFWRNNGKRIHQHWPKSPSKLGLTMGYWEEGLGIYNLNHHSEADKSLINRVKQSFEQVNTHWP